MSDDYLWDGSGTPDPDVERLERMLGRLKTTATPPVIRRAGFSAFAEASAAAIIVMISVTWQTTQQQVESWEVATTAGRPQIGSARFDGAGRLGVGQTLSTDAASRASLDVSTIGQVTIDENSRVRLVETREGRHRLALERGTLHAVIAAPPGEFVVDTPSATATDLGCMYSLHVDEDGSGVLSVASGWVAFEHNGRESFVPAGASSRTDPRVGPGTPIYDDATEEFRRAIDDFDFGRDSASKARDLQVVADLSRPRDAMTLWHLIARVPPDDRGRIADALSARVAMPDGVTRDAVKRLDRTSMDRWWDALGLLDTTWWRMWKGAYPAAQQSPAQAAAAPSCEQTEMVRATPPPTNNAGQVGEGLWWVNKERTIWIASATGPWHLGLNQKNMMIKPSGVGLYVSGTRIDASALPADVQTVPQIRYEFQTMGITFPAEGCWKITATAGDYELEFVTRVRLLP